MNKQLKQQGTHRSTRRKILLGGALLSSIPMSSKWGKPIINSVLLPAHAQTSMDPDPTPPAPPPAAMESFALSLAAPNGPSSQGAEFFVRVDSGVFTIEIFTDAQNTDLAPAILRATVNNIGELTDSVTTGCGDDGSEGPPASFSPRIQVLAYTPGVSVELEYQSGLTTFVVPLDSSASPVSCPIL